MTPLWVTAKPIEEWTGSTAQVPAGICCLIVSVLISSFLKLVDSKLLTQKQS